MIQSSLVAQAPLFSFGANLGALAAFGSSKEVVILSEYRIKGERLSPVSPVSKRKIVSLKTFDGHSRHDYWLLSSATNQMASREKSSSIECCATSISRDRS